MEKKCPMCSEFVNADAKRCKHCHYTLSLKNPQFIFPMLGVALLYGFIVYEILSVTRRAPASLSELNVQEYKVFDKKNNFRVIGKLKNNGAQPWNYVKVEAKFYDKDKQLVDIRSSRMFIKLKAGEEVDFKIDDAYSSIPLAFEEVKLTAIYVGNN